MAYPATKIIDINVRISSAGLSTADFSSAMLFIPQSDLSDEAQKTFPVDTYRTFGDTTELAEVLRVDEGGNYPEAYEAASAWLGGTPHIDQLMVYVRNPDDSSWAVTLDKARNQTWWYWTFATKPTYESATDVKQIAAWCEKNSSMFVNCQTGESATNIRNETIDTDIASALTTLGYRHCFTAVHETDAYSGIYLAKHFAKVNYSATDSTITGDYKKSPGLAAETLKSSEYTAMEKDTKNACFYTVIDLQGSNDNGRWKNSKTHSAYGEWIDDVVNLDAFTNALAVGCYNMVAKQPSKLPQTPRGQAMVLAAAKAVGEQYIANGFLGERTYTDPDDAQEKTTNGYEILSKPEDILKLSDSDRNARKCAPVNVRIFRAGAIHAVDITVDVY